MKCTFTFFSLFCFLQSLLATKTLVSVGQNEHIYFCIFAEREIAPGNVAKRTEKNEILPKCFAFRENILTTKKIFLIYFLHFSTIENHFFSKLGM